MLINSKKLSNRQERELQTNLTLILPEKPLTQHPFKPQIKRLIVWFACCGILPGRIATAMINRFGLLEV